MTSYGWNFDNSYQSLPDFFYTKMTPEAVKAPKFAVFNDKVAESLGLSSQLKDQPAFFSGNELPDGAEPLAQAYAGHQFAHFTMLGDGRAMLLGEQITANGSRLDVQLKGSGRTPYSRGGDGRAGLGPMLREYIISEAMHGLDIPTTRSLAVVTTGEAIYRETDFPGAILTRVAASHLRFGTFQYASQFGTLEDVRVLADYAIERHYPELAAGKDKYIAFFKAVAKRQAELIAKWQLAGFIHGVMNTDNMTISGETIDYGPCAFMDQYDPATVFSSIDLRGRYAYQNQPQIGGWNLARFAETLLPLFSEDQAEAQQLAQNALETYIHTYQEAWLTGMRKKLGLTEEQEADRKLAEELLTIMQRTRADYTNTFRALTLERYDGLVLFDTAEFAVWKEQWQQRKAAEKTDKQTQQEIMKQHNPAIIPRNHLVEEALEAAVSEENYQVMQDLVAVLQDPYQYAPEHEPYAKLPVPRNTPYQTFCGT